jgi:glycerophosphoryl diester phosphodiesterase
LLTATCVLSACHSDNKGGNARPFETLDGKQPLVIGHRGLPGLFPEETQPSYENAADVGADALEEDLHLTKDCVLVARHNPWLSDNTNIAAVAASNPAVAARKRTVPGRLVDVTYDLKTYGGPAQYLTDVTDPSDPKSVLKSLIVDGEDHTGDWSITDFTMAELKQWVRGTTFDDRDERPTVDNGRYPVLSFQEIIDIAKARSASTGRPLSVYPEAKNPIWNDAQAIANGCGAAGSHPLEDAMIRIISDNGLNNKDAPITVQSFDPESLKYFRSAGLKTKVVLLIDGNGVDYKTGSVIYRTNDASTFVSGRPYSWTIAGNGRYFGDLLTPTGLAEVRTYADGIGAWKPQVMSWLISPFPADAGGVPFAGTLADVNKIAPTSLIKDAHAAGLFVYGYTFRDETRYLPGVYRGDPKAEFIQFFEAGLDGAFTDFANTGVEAREDFLEQTGTRRE